MLSRNDIVEGIYLKQIAERYGDPPGLIAVVHQVGTQWTGEWFFQLRYLNRPAGRKKQTRSPWSLNFRENDIAHFELIGTWIPEELLQAPLPSVKPKKEPKLSARMRRTGHPNQLRLFEDF